MKKCGVTLIGFLVIKVIADAIIVETNIPEPNELEAAKQNPVLLISLPPADKEENTSGAPLPKARSVTPQLSQIVQQRMQLVLKDIAKLCDILSPLDIYSSNGDKQLSAVDPSTQKHKYTKKSYKDQLMRSSIYSQGYKQNALVKTAIIHLNKADW
ncbi:UNKNOWN [Stylonychia lemnae]|uniref:Uncharacterized protein n=1 Tax=Stylonychia lemnae TaxID=5949 RepID=A0A078ASV9_STYLE|nr:UNKNOWN [Stylonychia lemnae]|eukprot:CDW85274.1 UNKNOWN [Stylonychia lemnae]